ncbi:lanthionine synthetase LanC family protein [Lentzea chajnantorensis]
MSETYLGTAEAAWRWVLDQVRYDEGTAAVPPSPGAEADPDRDGMYDGVGGLALTLAEVRAVRAWTAEEQRLADAIRAQVTAGIATSADCSLFHGLVSTIGTLTALGEPAPDAAVARLLALVTPDGWPQTAIGPPRYLDGARVSDVVLGTAGVLLGAVWARRHGAEADELAEVAAGILLAEREEVPSGLNWRMVPPRFSPVERQMPNFSHGLAGVATALALAGAELGRPEWVAAALDGARHLVALADLTGGGFRVPLRIPRLGDDFEEYSYGWCHGPAGTALLWNALEHAGVFEVAGRTTAELRRRCTRTVRTCGLPERLRPGFWDNDGRCCGTAGVGALLLDAGERDFAPHLADVLVDRAVPDGGGVCWRFTEHRAQEPLLPPGVGWMQGAAGIAGFLFQAGRGGTAVPGMTNWWALTGPHRP